MNAEEARFWDSRYAQEGAIWGEDPSPTAVLASQYLNGNARILDVGCGYGRDLLFFGRLGSRVCGVELSSEGCRQALRRLQAAGVVPEQLLNGDFEEVQLDRGGFDGIISHRMAHLLLSRETIHHFAEQSRQLLRPGGILCVGARNREDLDPQNMILVQEGVYEYRDRPGHRIRYWDDETFQTAFGDDFQVLVLSRAAEDESASRPVPCHLTIMAARKK